MRGHSTCPNMKLAMRNHSQSTPGPYTCGTSPQSLENRKSNGLQIGFNNTQQAVEKTVPALSSRPYSVDKEESNREGTEPTTVMCGRARFTLRADDIPRACHRTGAPVRSVNMGRYSTDFAFSAI